MCLNSNVKITGDSKGVLSDTFLEVTDVSFKSCVNQTSS